MTGHEAVRNYQTRPELARVEANDHGWSVWLSPDATVVELAALMGGLGCKVEARDMGGGAFAIRPTDPNTPAPTAGYVAGILEHGIGRLPSLLCRQAE
jgi:hypothetical protein